MTFLRFRTTIYFSLSNNIWLGQKLCLVCMFALLLLQQAKLHVEDAQVCICKSSIQR